MAVTDLDRVRRANTGAPPPPKRPSGLAHVVAVARRPIVWGSALLVAIAVAGWFLFGGEDTASGEPIVVAATRGDIEDTVTALGSLQPKDYVDVGAQVSGQLKTLAVKIGDTVTKGQFLAEIDSTVQAQKVQADRDSLNALQASLAEKVAQASLAHAQQARQAALLKIGATPKDTYQVAEAAAKSADAQVAGVKAQIAQAQAQLNGDSATLGYSKIYAPMAGTVVSITSLQGQTLNASQTAPVILRIGDLSTMTVWTQVSEADVPKLRAGMNAYFTTLGSPDRRWTGTLRQILPTPEVVNNVVLYTALFDVANPTGQLLPQMTAQVFFVSQSAKGAITVPVAALHYGHPDGAAGAHRSSGQHRQGQSQSGNAAQHRPAGNVAGQPRPAWVTVVKDDGSTETRRVRVGVSNRVSAEILSGLAEGERVVAGTRQADAPSRAGQQQRGGNRGGPGGGGRFP